MDQAPEGGGGPGLEHGADMVGPHQQEVPREVHRVLREPRPGPGGGQDRLLLADGRRDVLQHVHPVPPHGGHRPGDGPSQADTADHHGAWGRGLPQLHRERVWPPGVVGLPTAGEQLQLSLCSQADEAGQGRTAAIPVPAEVRQSHAEAGCGPLLHDLRACLREPQAQRGQGVCLRARWPPVDIQPPPLH